MMNTVGSSSKADVELERRVYTFLGERGVRSLHNVEVHAREGDVVLRGTVTSFYQKQLCINCCQRVAGVRNLTDQIEVG